MLMPKWRRASRITAVPILLWTAPRSQEPVPYQISVRVDLVGIHATVRDRRGAFVPRLEKDNFHVFEDGVRQSVRLFEYEDVPVTVGLVVDHSGSMGAELPDVLAAARVFAAASNPDDEMFVINFNESAHEGLAAPARLYGAVAASTSPAALRPPAGHIPGASLPGHGGNAAIAGHRDTLFLAQATEESLTLVTCHPFDFIGRAPSRFIVRAKRVVDSKVRQSGKRGARRNSRLFGLPRFSEVEVGQRAEKAPGVRPQPLTLGPSNPGRSASVGWTMLG